MRWDKHIGQESGEAKDLTIHEEFLEGLSSTIDATKDESYNGYLIKIIDEKPKKLWFTLFEKYLYCKIYLNIIYFYLKPQRLQAQIRSNA